MPKQLYCTSYCRALVPNVIVDGKDDDDDDEEEDEKKTGAAGEQFASDVVHTVAVKQSSEESSDADDHGQFNLITRHSVKFG